MISFSGYKSVIYDANCIIYYCFKTEQLSRKGTLVIIDSPPYTDITRNLTQYLIDIKIKVRTVLVVFEEITEEVLSRTIKQRISDEYLRRELGLSHGEKFPEDIEYRLNKKLKKKVKRMRYERWFELDEQYTPKRVVLDKIRAFFEKRKTLIGHKGMPSYNDITLILYSKDTILPLISNDRHICDFREDLEKAGYTHKIVPLEDCVVENLD